MIVHLLLLQTSGTRSAYDEQQLGEALYALKAIPAVHSMTWGPDFSGRAKGYTHAAVLQFADRDALQSYLDHPEHKRVVEILNRLAPDRLIADYEAGPD
jgi:aminoglycoside phosphotransferase (APT) family kinase protein